jgi:hypothetical protein
VKIKITARGDFIFEKFGKKKTPDAGLLPA